MEDTNPIVEPNSPGDEFEPTAEMMVNDFDDERTLDEEEAMEEADDQQNELSNLEKEKDMPLDQLMAMYGYDAGNDGSQSSSSEEILSNQDLTLDKEEIGRDLLGEEEEGDGDGDGDEQDDEEHEDEEEEDVEHLKENQDTETAAIDDVQQEVTGGEADDEEEKPQPSMLHELYNDHPSGHGGNARHLRSGSRQHSEEEEEEGEDGDYSPEEDDWKKTIMVGSDYQAVIPDDLHKYGDAMPYENEDKLLWSPSIEKNVREYLTSVQNIQTCNVTNTLDSIPKGSHVRDDEQALYLLLQCGHNTDEALRRQRINLVSTTDTLSLWSEEECRNFETGLRQYGKDFHSIQQNKVRTRSVSELVQFYYLWKKTERHDVFANKARLEKKKYTLHPGTTDFMEKFLDEQESPVSSPNVHSLLSGDPKRQARTPPPVSATQTESESVPTYVEEARMFHKHLEEIAHHLKKDGLDALVKLANPIRQSNGQPGDSVTIQLGKERIFPSERLLKHSHGHNFTSPS